MHLSFIEEKEKTMIGLIYEWEQTADFITVNVQLPGMLFRKPRLTGLPPFQPIKGSGSER